LSFKLEIEGDQRLESIKVLFLTHNYIRFKGDFAGVFLHLLARQLREEGVEVVVVAPHDATLPDSETIEGIKIHRFRYGKDEEETFAYRGEMHRQLFRNPFKIFLLIRFLKSAYHLACSVIEKENLSVVSVHWVIPNGVVAHFLKKRYKDKIKLIFSSHGTDIRLLCEMPLIHRFFRPIIKQAKAWTVVSSYLKSKITKLGKEAAYKVTVVPLPNDETLFYPDPQVHKEPMLVVAVSRLTGQKRISFLLEAMKAISKELPEARLEIYGTGPEKLSLARRIDELGLKGRAIIKEPVPQQELRKVYNLAAVVVLNSIEEGFGLALTEAMLCRTAVIGTNSGGITDIIEDKQTGLLVPPDDIEKLADAIGMILKDRHLRARLAEAGYRKALAQFSSRSSARKFAELFRKK
jgi:glycosyltransferase involved in cell wall biosynthesis